MHLNVAMPPCDDLPEERNTLARLVRHYAASRQIQLQLDTADSGLHLMSQLRGPGAMGCGVFGYLYGGHERHSDRPPAAPGGQPMRLDLCHQQPRAWVESYELRAADYLVKPFAQQEVDNALDWCMEEQRENWRTLTLLSEWEPVEVRLRQIDYIEIKGHTAHIHMNSGRVIQVRKGLDALEAEIDSGDFLRCHRSFLVNMASIQRVDRTDFVLAGDVRVPIGSQNEARARQCFTQWVMDHTWR